MRPRTASLLMGYHTYNEGKDGAEKYPDSQEGPNAP